MVVVVWQGRVAGSGEFKVTLLVIVMWRLFTWAGLNLLNSTSLNRFLFDSNACLVVLVREDSEGQLFSNIAVFMGDKRESKGPTDIGGVAFKS